MYAIPYIAGKCRNFQIIRVPLIGRLFFHECLLSFLLSLHCTLWQACGYFDCWRCDRTPVSKTVVAYGRSNKSKTIVKRSIEWNKNLVFQNHWTNTPSRHRLYTKVVDWCHSNIKQSFEKHIVMEYTC